MAICRCSCGAKFKVPDTSLGKKAKCKKCGSVFTLAVEDDGIIPIADDPWPDMGEITQAAATATRAASVAAPTPPPGYKGVIIEGPDTSESSAGHGGAPGAGGFFSSVLWTILFPTTPANLFAYVGIFVLLVIGVIASFAPLIGAGSSFIIAGWYAAFRFNIVQSAAAGDDTIPGLAYPSDWVDDLIAPFFAWLGSWLIVLLPAFIYIIIDWQQGNISGWEVFGMIFGGFDAIWNGPQGASKLYYVFLCGGLSLWPMVILCVALGGFASLSRIDLLFVTIAKTFPAYAITLALVAGTMVLGVVLTDYVASKAAPGPNTTASGILSKLLILRVAIIAILVYADIVMVRLIGLYYHHFKSKFAWSWG